MKNIYLAILACLLLAYGCNPKKSQLKNRWVLLEKPGISAEERRGLYRLMHSLPIVVHDYTGDPLSGSFLQFSLTGKYNLRMNTIYSEGKWELENDSTIMLVASTADSIPLRFNFRKDTLSVYFLPGHSFANYLNYLSNDTAVTFITDTISYFFKANPYGFSKNQWAVKSKHKLSEREIRQKLVNYLDYLILILKDERDNSRYLDKIANPIRIASNGISLVRKKAVEPEWQNIFYDQEGFEKAYDLLQNTFDCNIILKETLDFTELDSDILSQMKRIISQEKTYPCEF